MNFEEIWTITLEFVNENALIVTIMIALLAYLGYTTYKKLQKNKKVKPAVKAKLNAPKYEPVRPEPVKQPEPRPKPESTETFENLFSEMNIEDVKNNDDMNTRIMELTKDMESNAKEIDDNIVRDFKSIHAELKEVSSNKQKIKKYGMQLSDLYQKYSGREMQLQYMITSLEKLAKHQKIILANEQTKLAPSTHSKDLDQNMRRQ